MGIVFYTDRFIPARFAGMAVAIFIFIRPKYKNDYGLLAHERVHVKQFLRSPFLHGLKYQFNKEYRYQCEIEAYARQINVNRTDELVKKYAEFIATRYNLDISIAKAEEDLRNAISI